MAATFERELVPIGGEIFRAGPMRAESHHPDMASLGETA
jgi:hypothetical protein